MGCKDRYFVIFKGDDTDFRWNRTLTITLSGDGDLTGFSATFRFLNFTQTFSEIPDDRTLKIVIPRDVTMSFPCGSMDASLRLTDPSGKERTVDNRIHVLVTQSVEMAYDGEDPQAISVSLGADITTIVNTVMNEVNKTLEDYVTKEEIVPSESHPGWAANAHRAEYAHESARANSAWKVDSVPWKDITDKPQGLDSVVDRVSALEDEVGKANAELEEVA